MPDRYKVFFHYGEKIGLKTQVSRGTAWIDASALHIEGPDGISTIPIAAIKEVDLFRLHGTSRVIRIDYQGGTVYLAVVRFMIGQFASVNFFKTGELHEIVANLASSNST